MIETNLINFSSLDRDPTSDRRNELMRSVAALFAVTSEKCSHEEIEIYDQVLGRLADMVEVEARAYASAKIAPLRRAPENTVRRFARDDIRVAGPVLGLSPVLNDVDLLAIADGFGRDHLAAMAGRANLSEEVTDLIIERGDPDVRRTIAANTGATISACALQVLVDQALADVATATALGNRPDTPDGVIADLVQRASAEVRRAFMARGLDKDAEVIAGASKVAHERMSNSYWIGLYDFETAWARLLQLGGSKNMSEALLVRFAMEDRFPEAVAAFALITSISLEEAKHWLVRADTDPFLTVAKAYGFRYQTIQALLKVGPWKHRLGNDARTAALNTYLTLDARVARDKFASYMQTRRVG
ncbi:DUF2336 domain-containing protein [Methylobrevis albus]|uniref:DUF2336 domain-containing protein n=1 Tax=Methylobrevis albus TaxID=2793297 RepID=A0A931HZ51_9HYPH|nr:DUF2336 domain-containing protein [Methylobrevis albus]MBH0236315.1 DUF2336 domain-containing protein [Methylobrevis albus]